MGEPAWQDVPGEYRSDLRRLLVVQGDTEPASVEQQRPLVPDRAEPLRPAQPVPDQRRGGSPPVGDGVPAAPLLRSRRSRRGRRDARAPLRATPTSPRILGAFNEPTPDWLSFFFFTYFTDRDGKFQLASLRESGVRPAVADVRLHAEGGGAPHVRGRDRHRSRRAAHRRADEGARHRRRPAPFGGIDVATLQRYLNFHFSVSLDLFGAETSTNAANYFAAGLKGRFQEERRDDDHRLQDATRARPDVADGADRHARGAGARPRSTRRCATTTSPTASKGVDRWNRTLAEVDLELRLPHVGFNRARRRRSPAHRVSPDGGSSSDDGRGSAPCDDWLPTAADRQHVESLMIGVHEPGKMAGWIAPPAPGIHAKPRRLRLRAGLIDVADGATMTTTTRPPGCSTATSTAGARRPRRVRVRRASTRPTPTLQTRGVAGPARPARARIVRRASASLLVVNDEPAFLAWFLGALRSGVVPVPLSTMLTGRRPRRRSSPTPAPAWSWSRPSYAGHARRDRAGGAPSCAHAVVVGDADRRRGRSPVHPWSAFTDDRRGAGRRHDRRLARVLAVQLGHDRRAQGRDAPPRQPAGDRRDLRRDGPRASAPTTACLSVAKLFFAYGLGQLADVPALRRRAPRSSTRPGRRRRGRRARSRRSSPRCSSPAPASWPRCSMPTRRRDAFASVRLRPSPPARRCRPTSSAASASGSGIPCSTASASTEALHIFLSNTPTAQRPGTSGAPVPGYEVKLLDDERRRGDRPRHARLPARAWAVDRHRLLVARPTRPRAAFRGDWLRTGDVYTRSDDGYWTFLGRNNDMIKAGGIWVSPAEVESGARRAPRRARGRRRRARATPTGSRPTVAFVVAAAGPRDRRRARSTRTAATRMAAFKRPRRVHRRRRAAQDRHRQDPALRPAPTPRQT